ncbi:hypothetical protein ECC02_007359 [Trypanosoma cruzi]|uniref:Mucin TcMUCII n=2 Tax=Trypanosoma cruzi TaxID=5693 RepID=A0A7J6XYW5_TRYCR|nr:hypothetical protein ECC02_007359 [Trypanosoma cruzi]
MQTPSTLQKETRINGCFIPFLALDFACAAAAAVVAALPVDQQSTWCAGISPFSMVTLLLCCCGRCTYSLVCVPSVRGADTTDRSRRMYMRWSLVCRSCLLLPPPSVCWCCGRAACVCVPAAVDWSVCRAWCAAYGACLAAALSSCGVPSVCVCRTSRLPCCSPCPSLCRSAPHHRTTTLTMMMTCRLLCALLVLALCCCPSVCVTGTGEDQEEDSSGLPPAQSPGAGGTGSQSTSSKEHTGSESQTSQGLSSGNGTTQNPGENDAVGSSKPDGKEPNSGTTTDIGKGKGTGSAPSASPDPTPPGPITEEQPSGSANPVQQIQKANAPTTTSTAPEASSTTTTETPTTTTTRAPSRLREIDGSLSSSAWVCAPLLLAVSALAYTTLG